VLALFHFKEREFAAKEKLVPILYEQSEFTKSRILDGQAIGKIVPQQ